MRQVEIERFGGPEELHLRAVPEPEPPVDGYVVDVCAAGLNYADVVERRGRYRKDQSLPALLGKEAAGVVVARGPEANEFGIGDPVIVVRFGNGCYAERIACAPHEVLRPPQGFTWIELAAFATNFATAWWAMTEIARVRPGESALVQAAAGGVGSAAILLARSLGLTPVIGTAGGPTKTALVHDLGADTCVDYNTADVAAEVLERTDGRGVDFCLESVGGDAYRDSLRVLAPKGRLVVIGFSSIEEDYANVVPRLHPLTVFHRSITVGGLNLDNLAFQRERDVWDRLVDHVEEHGLRPHIGHVFPFDRVADAHRCLEQRASTGKVVLSVQPDAAAPPLDLRDRPTATTEAGVGVGEGVGESVPAQPA